MDQLEQAHKTAEGYARKLGTTAGKNDFPLIGPGGRAVILVLMQENEKLAARVRALENKVNGTGGHLMDGR